MFWITVLAVVIVASVFVYHALRPADDVQNDGNGMDGRGLIAVSSIHLDGGANHLHGIGYDAGRDALYLATHRGLFLLQAATADADSLFRFASPTYDFMGFQAHPGNGDLLYASGHPESGGNLGLLRSYDGGATWALVSTGAGEEVVDFHAMSVSPSDPELVAGWYGGRLYRSEDGGTSWTTEAVPGGACWGAPCLSLDAQEPGTIWRSDLDGIHVRTAGAENWTGFASGAHGGLLSHPADGSLWAWGFETGAHRYAQPGLGASPTPVALALPDRAYVFQWSGDAERGGVVFAATVDPSGRSAVHRTLDGGSSWELLVE